MVDYRNHRTFTLRCIKVRVTPVSWRIRNPLYVKTTNIYHIIQTAERQLLYERVRNINRILCMYEHNWTKLYSQLSNLIIEEDIFRCTSFINKIKEHRYLKVKRRQINKFECLVYKGNGYSHNYGNSLEGCPPSSYSSYSKCWFQHPNPHHSTCHNSRYSTNNTQGTHHFSGYNFFHSHQYSSTTNQDKWVINLSNTPLLQLNFTTLQGTQSCHHP